MVNIHFRDEDERLASNATHLDDIDLVHSKLFTGPWGPALVAVAQKAGVHVCWRCGGMFDTNVPEVRPTEVKHGTAYILLHAKCVEGQRLTSARSVDDIFRGLQVRRGMASVAKASQSVADAAAAGSQQAAADSPIILFPK